MNELFSFFLKSQLIHEKNLSVYPKLFVYTILWLTITSTISNPYVPTCASMSHWTPAQFILFLCWSIEFKGTCAFKFSLTSLKTKWNIEAVVWVMILREKETIVKNRITWIKLECTSAFFFFKSSLGWLSSKMKFQEMSNSRSGRLPKESLFKFPEKKHVCTLQIIKPKFFTFTLTENIDLFYLQKELKSKSLYSVLMDRSSKF